MAFLDEAGLAQLWALVKAEDAKLAAVDVKFQAGSYSGTGKYGLSNPSSLTFSFAPKIVAIYANIAKSSGTIYVQTDATWILPMEKLTTEYVMGNGFSSGGGHTWGKKSSDGKTVYWYNNEADGYQLNSDSAEYCYFAIG